METKSPQPEDVDHLMRNAELRNALEPYLDEAVIRIDSRHLSTPMENEFLASMLAWERAPVVPIYQWFDPPLELPHPDTLGQPEEDVDGTNEKLREVLWDTIEKLYEKCIVLDFTDHLTDRQLYTLIYRDILPTEVKRMDDQRRYLHWDCADVGGSQEIWLRYYATLEDREQWLAENDEDLPESETPPYPRDLPRPR
ncbi:MAG: hypothetical protein MI757_05485 [Pirellulales bacterium]|nr:hypothetical protein [Pirellulales bacterium]